MKPLAGASALIFLNKTELDGCLDNKEISEVPGLPHQQCSLNLALIFGADSTAGCHRDARIPNDSMQCERESGIAGGNGMGGGRHQDQEFSLLSNLIHTCLAASYNTV